MLEAVTPAGKAAGSDEEPVVVVEGVEDGCAVGELDGGQQVVAAPLASTPEVGVDVAGAWVSSSSESSPASGLEAGVVTVAVLDGDVPDSLAVWKMGSREKTSVWACGRWWRWVKR